MARTKFEVRSSLGQVILTAFRISIALLLTQNSFSKPAIATTNDRSFLQSYHRSQHFIAENGHFLPSGIGNVLPIGWLDSPRVSAVLLLLVGVYLRHNQASHTSQTMITNSGSTFAMLSAPDHDP